MAAQVTEAGTVQERRDRNPDSASSLTYGPFGCSIAPATQRSRDARESRGGQRLAAVLVPRGRHQLNVTPWRTRAMSTVVPPSMVCIHNSGTTCIMPVQRPGSRQGSCVKRSVPPAGAARLPRPVRVMAIPYPRQRAPHMHMQAIGLPVRILVQQPSPACNNSGCSHVGPMTHTACASCRLISPLRGNKLTM